MSDEEIKQSFKQLMKQVDELSFSEDSIIELGSIKIEAVRLAKKITNSKYRKFCINEIEQLDSDEFEDMYTGQNEQAFYSAQSEFSLILRDCIKGEL